jgi:hypothetical protein
MQGGGGDLAAANQACVTLAELAGLAALALVALFFLSAFFGSNACLFSTRKAAGGKAEPSFGPKVTSSPLEC